jgi:hypothetical protein
MAREIAQELVDATIGERMHEEVSKDAGTNRDRIGARDSTFGKLNRRGGTHGNDVALRTGRIESGAQLAHGIDPSMAHLVELIDGRDHRARARLRGE